MVLWVRQRDGATSAERAVPHVPAPRAVLLPRGRMWLLGVELAWYVVVLIDVVVLRAATLRPVWTVEYWVLAGLAVVCVVGAVARWWRPAWTGPGTLAVLALVVLVLDVRPLGPLGPLRLITSEAVIPVLLAASTRRARPVVAVAAVGLAAVAAGLDVARGGNTVSMNVAHQLIHGDPSGPLVLVTAMLLVVVPAAVGILLRSIDTARRAQLLARLRSAERLQVARELHDLVANHVTGIILTAQAARLTDDPAPVTDRALCSIESAGDRALGAMARMVGALRSQEVQEVEDSTARRTGTWAVPDELRSAGVHEAQLTHASTPLAAVRAAVGDDERVRLDLGDGFAPSSARRAEAPTGPDLVREVGPDVVVTVHRIVAEALTNARRHGPAGAPIDVALTVLGPGMLVVEITNELARGPGRTRSGGYGLVGLRERVDAVGGCLEAGPVESCRWRLRAELPY